MICTIFKNIYSKEPYYVPVSDALKRIETGRSKILVDEIRNCLDKEKSNALKCNLPSVCFSGKFEKDRKDESLIEHSGFIVLDFDNVYELREKQNEIITHPFVYACWVSPSGKGLKALIKIADGKKHRLHFQSLQEVFPEVDKSGINQSRVCYESHDPDIYVNENADIFNKTKKVEKITVVERNEDYDKIFKNLLFWLSNRNDAFVKGERNTFIFKLASACCRFGIPESIAQSLISIELLIDSEFTTAECNRTIRSAYRANSGVQGTAAFEKEQLIDKITRKEIEVDSTFENQDDRPKDVIYGIDVKKEALELYEKGYPKIFGIEDSDFDFGFKHKRGEMTLLTGIGNAGKSTFKKWIQIIRAVLYDEKFACFGPEDFPAEEYYFDLTEVLLGCDLTPFNKNKPPLNIFESAYDFVINHFFYVYPKDNAATPEYICQRFLELIVKEKIDGADIDPFNQMSNNYQGYAGRDKYLEYVLTFFSRFAQVNNIYLWIVAHPTKLAKIGDNYVCPDVFDVADGAMWNNKMDNILVYHKPVGQSDPQNPMCELHRKKIRRQKVVGKKGFLIFEMIFDQRRFFINGGDPLQRAINKRGLNFVNIKYSPPVNKKTTWTPYKDDDGDEEQLPF